MVHVTPSRVGLVLTGLAWLACAPDRDSVPGDPPPRAEHARSVPFLDDRVKESSGVAVSRDHPGILWTHNDSGDQAWLYATDTLGRARGRLLLHGADNRDWEDVALGPCPTGSCLYLADTGDNRRQRNDVVIYRVREPATPFGNEAVIGNVESVHFSYRDGPHDVEAMFVGPAGDVHLVSKGTREPIHHYRLPASAWLSARPAVAEDLGELPIRPDRSSSRFSPDSEKIQVFVLSSLISLSPSK